MAERILVTRTDRLGDVLLALPAVRWLRDTIPHAELLFLCPPRLHKLLAPTLTAWDVELVPEAPLETSGQRKYLKGLHLTAALFLHSPKGILYAAWRAGIPLRVGLRGGRLEWIFLNHSRWQHRSRAVQTEGEYNLDLARLLAEKLGKSPTEVKPVWLAQNDHAMAAARELLQTRGVDSSESLLILHPGMGGSALNLSLESYGHLVVALRASWKGRIALSVGPADQDQTLARGLTERFDDLPILQHPDLSVLAELFRKAKAVIAPSTGPLHLAHFVKTPTLGLYPPIRGQSWARWQPWGSHAPTHGFSPSVSCPASSQCMGARCQFYPCMEGVDWAERIVPILTSLQ